MGGRGANRDEAVKLTHEEQWRTEKKTAFFSTLLGIRRRTVARRLADPVFAARVTSARRETVERTAALLTAAADDAVRTLLGLQKETVKASARLGAARAVLEFGIKYRELAELEAELKDLEERAAAARAAGGPR